MLINTDFEFMTPNQQRFMLLLYLNDNKPLSFKAQTFYSNQQHFEKETKKLIIAGFLSVKREIHPDMRVKIKDYSLTFPKGMVYVEENILKYNKRLGKC